MPPRPNAPDPDRARAHDALGVLTLRARWLDRAPESLDARTALLLTALLRLEVARTMGAASAPEWTAVAPALGTEVTEALSLDDEAVAAVLAALAGDDDADERDGAPERLGAMYESLLGWTLVRRDGALAWTEGEARRRSGSHYTSAALTDQLARDTLAPLLDREATPRADAILALRVCDPSMGAGAFLLAACRVLAERLATAWRTEGAHAHLDDEALLRDARRAVANACLYGVDVNPLAVELARRALWLQSHADQDVLDAHLQVGDALVERALAKGPSHARPFVWRAAFAAVFEGGGFDAMVGNPPWVSYAGRAAQPLDDARRGYYAREYPSFQGYRNLQGLFVERAASLLRPGGRLGLILPSSMAELDGYGPTRAAHDRWAECDAALPDLGERAFRGVHQPAMALRSTVRATPRAVGSAAPWPLARPDLDPEALAILACLTGDPLPPACFGERGLQTASADLAHLASAPDAVHSVALRVGSDVRPFARAAPSRYADPAWFQRRLRSAEAWRAVDVLVRQTARVPMAAVSDGEGFRNSLLACFACEAFSAECLVAYLNASPIRWRHYHLHRDARLGMPQVKIGHLRGIPRPPASIVGALTTIGAALSAQNEGCSDDDQRALDALVSEGFGIDAAGQARIARDAARWNITPA